MRYISTVQHKGRNGRRATGCGLRYLCARIRLVRVRDERRLQNVLEQKTTAKMQRRYDRWIRRSAEGYLHPATMRGAEGNLYAIPKQKG